MIDDADTKKYRPTKADRETTLTTRDLLKAFDITPMTVYNWRCGSTRVTPLPYTITQVGARTRIHFNKATVRTWLETNGMQDPWKGAETPRKALIGKDVMQRGNPQQRTL